MVHVCLFGNYGCLWVCTSLMHIYDPECKFIICFYNIIYVYTDDVFPKM